MNISKVSSALQHTHLKVNEKKAPSTLLEIVLPKIQLRNNVSVDNRLLPNENSVSHRSNAQVTNQQAERVEEKSSHSTCIDEEVLEDSDDELNFLRERNKVLENDLYKLQVFYALELKKEKEKNDVLKQKLTQTTNLSDSVVDYCEEIKLELENRKKDIETLKEENAALKKQYENNGKEITDLYFDVLAKDNEIQELHERVRELEEINKSSEEIKLELESRKKDLETLNDINVAFKKRYEDDGQLLINLNFDILGKDKEIEALKAQNAELQKNNKDFCLRDAKVQSELMLKNDKIRELKKKAEEHESIKRKSEEIIQNYENAINENKKLQAQSEELIVSKDRATSDVQKQLELKEKEIEALKAQLSLADAEVKKTQQQMEINKNAHETLKLLNDRLVLSGDQFMTFFNETVSRLEVKVTENQNLTDELNAAKRKIETLEKELVLRDSQLKWQAQIVQQEQALQTQQNQPCINVDQSAFPEIMQTEKDDLEIHLNSLLDEEIAPNLQEEENTDNLSLNALVEVCEADQMTTTGSDPTIQADSTRKERRTSTRVAKRTERISSNSNRKRKRTTTNT